MPYELWLVVEISHWCVYLRIFFKWYLVNLFCHKHVYWCYNITVSSLSKVLGFCSGIPTRAVLFYFFRLEFFRCYYFEKMTWECDEIFKRKVDILKFVISILLRRKFCWIELLLSVFVQLLHHLHFWGFFFSRRLWARSNAYFECSKHFSFTSKQHVELCIKNQIIFMIDFLIWLNVPIYTVADPEKNVRGATLYSLQKNPESLTISVEFNLYLRSFSR